MLFPGGYWEEEGIYRMECTYKGQSYKICVLLDHKSFCLQGEGKPNPHLSNLLGSLLIK